MPQYKIDTLKGLAVLKDFMGCGLVFMSFVMMQLVYCCVRYKCLNVRMESCGKPLYVSGSRILARKNFPKLAKIKPVQCTCWFYKYYYKFKT